MCGAGLYRLMLAENIRRIFNHLAGKGGKIIYWFHACWKTICLLFALHFSFLCFGQVKEQ